MSLAVQPELTELRERLLLRCGLAAGGAVPDSIRPVLDERLRQAQTVLHTNLDFTRLWGRTEVPLTAGVAEYDWPGQYELGDLRRVIVKRFDDFEYDLEPGLRTNERNTAYRAGASGFTLPVNASYTPPVAPPLPASDYFGDPMRWTVENQKIRLAPAPDTQWTGLIYEGFLAPSPLVADTDRCTVDPEALLQYAEVLVKQHFMMPGIDSAQAVFGQYIDDLRSKQSMGDGFQLGAQQSARTMPQIRNRIARPPLGAQGTQWWQDPRTWRPW